MKTFDTLDLCIFGTATVVAATMLALFAPATYIVLFAAVITLLVVGTLTVVAVSLMSSGSLLDMFIGIQIAELAGRILLGVLHVTICAAGGSTSSD